MTQPTLTLMKQLMLIPLFFICIWSDISDSHQCALNLWRVKCYVYFLVFVTENLLPGNRECTLTNSIPELFFDNYNIYYLRHPCAAKGLKRKTLYVTGCLKLRLQSLCVEGLHKFYKHVHQNLVKKGFYYLSGTITPLGRRQST